MTSSGLAVVLSVVLVTSLAGCSSSDSSGNDSAAGGSGGASSGGSAGTNSGGTAGVATGGAGGAGPLAPFSAYCTGTLGEQAYLMTPVESNTWVNDGSLPPAKIGTPFLVAKEADRWEGYVILADGTPGRIATGWAGLSNFSSSCIDTTAFATTNAIDVLLTATDFFAAQDFSGAPCHLPAGTALSVTSYTQSTGAVSAAQIKAQCGWGTGYAKDIYTAYLIPL